MYDISLLSSPSGVSSPGLSSARERLDRNAAIVDVSPLRPSASPRDGSTNGPFAFLLGTYAGRTARSFDGSKALLSFAPAFAPYPARASTMNRPSRCREAASERRRDVSEGLRKSGTTAIPPRSMVRMALSGRTERADA